MLCVSETEFVIPLPSLHSFSIALLCLALSSRNKHSPAVCLGHPAHTAHPCPTLPFFFLRSFTFYPLDFCLFSFLSSLSSFLLLTYHPLPSPPLFYSFTFFTPARYPASFSYTSYFTRGKHRTHPHPHASSLFFLFLYISNYSVFSYLLPFSYHDLNKEKHHVQGV